MTIVARKITLLVVLAVMQITNASETKADSASPLAVVNGQVLLNGKVFYLEFTADEGLLPPETSKMLVADLVSLMQNAPTKELKAIDRDLFYRGKTVNFAVFYDLQLTQRESDKAALAAVEQFYKDAIIRAKNRPATPPVVTPAPKPSPRVKTRDDFAKEEKDTLKKAAYQVKLFESRDLRPTFVAMDENYIYFSNYLGYPGCHGKHVYRAKVGTTRAERIMESECVGRLDATPEGLVVHFKETQSSLWSTMTLRGGERHLSLPPAIESGIAAQLKPIYSGKAPTGVRHFYRTAAKYFLAFRETAFDRGYLYVFEKNQTAFAPSIQLTLSGIPYTSDLGPNENLDELYVLYGKEGSYRLAHARLKLNSWEWKHYGSNAKLPDWQSIAADVWHVRSPKFMTPMKYGFLLAETTDDVTEPRSIMYYAGSETRFYRIPVPSDDVGGLEYFSGGLVVARPQAGVIHWYGPSPKQWEEKVLPEDISQNPSVPFEMPVE